MVKLSSIASTHAAYRCVALIVVIVVIIVTIQGDFHKKLSYLFLSEFYSDQILDVVPSPDGASSSHRFENGVVAVRVLPSINSSLPDIPQLTTMDRTTLINLYERLLLNVTANCSVSRSFGLKSATTSEAEASDIGQASLCMVGRFEPRRPCYSFSFGSSATWEFESSLALSTGCHVFAFDPNMKQQSHRRSERLALFKEGLSNSVVKGTDKSAPSDNIFGYLTRFDALTAAIDLIKIDVGQDEWSVLQRAVQDGSLRNVKQLVLRIRQDRSSEETETELQRRIVTLINLYNVGFRLWAFSKRYYSSYVTISFINVRALSKSETFRNPSGTRVAIPSLNTEPLNAEGYLAWRSTTSSPELGSVLPKAGSLQAKNAISLGPHYDRLQAVKQANLGPLSPAQLDILYFDLVEQQHVVCPQSRRIGDSDDGGWDVCFTDPFNVTKSKPCIAYSFGINNVWAYDDQLADVYHCRVYMFDPSMTKVNDHQRRNTSWFYRIGLSANNTNETNGWKMRTLCHLFDEMGHSEKVIDILKIDIDYWEWVTFETALKDGCLKRVKQFMFETHTTGLFRKPSDYARFIRILKGIFELGFRTWKWHKNPYSVFYQIDSNVTRACCYEHYMVNTGFIVT